MNLSKNTRVTSGLAKAALVLGLTLASPSEAQLRARPSAGAIQRMEDGFRRVLQPAALTVDTPIHIHAMFMGSTGRFVLRHGDELSSYKVGDIRAHGDSRDPRRASLSRFIADQMMHLRVDPFAKEYACVDLDFILPARAMVPSATVPSATVPSATVPSATVPSATVPSAPLPSP